jgi:uncharacterized protein (DUF1501 family)
MSTTSYRGFDRRAVLAGGLSVVGGSLVWPLAGRADPSAQDDEDGEPPILVVIELIGGNDGLSTVVPYSNDAYYRNRPTEGIPAKDVLPLDDHFGLHPTLSGLRETFETERMAILQGVGYPSPVYSHFKSFEIWHTARLAGRSSGDGWLARLRAAAWPDDPRPELLTHVGLHQPYSVFSSDRAVLAFEAPSSFLWAGEAANRRSYEQAAREAAEDQVAMEEGQSGVLARMYRTLRHAQATSPRILEAADKYEPKVAYPAGKLGESLRTIAAMIEARIGTRIFNTALENFDTHGNQKRAHAALLRELDQNLTAFLADLEGRTTARNVLVMVVSEFGRRVKENHSKGTDHGAAGVSFLLGPRVKGGFYGAQPSLTELDQDGNLVFNTDFRSLYGTVIEDWFGLPQKAVLPDEFERLPVFKS